MPLKKKYTKKSKKVKARLVGGKRVKPIRRKLVRKSLKRKRVKGKKHRGGSDKFEYIKKKLKLSSYDIRFQREVYNYDNYENDKEDAFNFLSTNPNPNHILIFYTMENYSINYNTIPIKNLKEHTYTLRNEFFIIIDVEESEVNNFFINCINNYLISDKRKYYRINYLVIHNDHKNLFETEFKKIVTPNFTTKIVDINIPNFSRINFLLS
jgi:hypothetical protein